MKLKNKICISLDYSIRIPAFKNSYARFKEWLYKDDFGITFDEEDEISVKDDTRIYWNKQLKDDKVMSFYLSKTPESIKDAELKGDFSSYFFNEEHLNKFIEEYTFNLYSDCEIACKRDIDYINVCQAQLFDVVIIDIVNNPRKVSNTLHFLSKSRIYFKELRFISRTEKINEKEFIGIWDPVKNKEQVNKDKGDIFINWLKELESKEKAEREEHEKMMEILKPRK